MIFIQSMEYDLWSIISNGPLFSTKEVEKVIVSMPEAEWNDTDKRILQLNAKAKHNLYCSLDASEFNRISACDTAKEIWVKLEWTYEGTNQVEESKISMRFHKYVLFKMNPSEFKNES